MANMKKIPFGVRVGTEAETKEEMKEVAIYSDKGVPFFSPNGKVWLVQVDDTGNLTVTEVV